MPTRITLRLVELLLPIALCAILFAAWRADHREQAKLAADLAAAKQTLAQVDARQHDRDAHLLQTLAALAAQKRAATTPTQIAANLARQIPLPAPITLQPQPCDPGPAARELPPSTSGTKERSASAPPVTPCSPGLPRSSKGPPFGPDALDSARSTKPYTDAKPAPDGAVIPAVDLKPLYDFTLDCQACQAKLAAAQADLTDERAKTTILSRERDQAVRTAKGGSLMRRIARNAKWLAIGAAAGALAARAHR